MAAEFRKWCLLLVDTGPPHSDHAICAGEDRPLHGGGAQGVQSAQSDIDWDLQIRIFQGMPASQEVSAAKPAENYEKLRRELVQSSRISPLATIVTDASGPDNAIIAVNNAFEKLSGYSEAEVVGQDCRILSGKATSPAAKAILRKAIEAGAPAFETLLNYRKNGEPFYNAVMIAPVYDESGILAFFLGTQLEVAGEFVVSDAKARLADLSPQQLRVLDGMARGLRQAEIAKALGLSVKTVKMHRGALVKRLGVATSTEAIRIAVEAGL